MLAALDPNGRQLRYADSFNWLADAGVALPCYNVGEPQPPLMLNEKRNLFKLFMGDTGLLCAACMENVQFEILNGALQINMGSILENVVAQQLKCNGFQLNYYDGKKTGEIDFVIQNGMGIELIEAKSGNDSRYIPPWTESAKQRAGNLKKRPCSAKEISNPLMGCGIIHGIWSCS